MHGRADTDILEEYDDGGNDGNLDDNVYNENVDDDVKRQKC